jgi:putative ABC transport system permease protein
MKLKPRWMKIIRDLKATRGRVLMMILALAIGIFSVSMIVSAYTILMREISRNYMETHPASFIFEMDHVDDQLVKTIRQHPEVSDAEASSTILARYEIKPGEWRSILLFVIEDFNHMRINTFQPEAGDWPPAEGTMLVERQALPLMNARMGDAIVVQTPNGKPIELKISGQVHDPGLAPAWQEQLVYAYITPATLSKLEGNRTLHLLKVIIKDGAYNDAVIERVASDLSQQLKQGGYAVKEIRIPPPGKHPHQNQMSAILTMFFIFSLLTLFLSAILTAALIGGLLAQQVRQIGIMKTVGARTAQIRRMYLTLVAFIGLVAVMLGIPVGSFAGIGFAQVVADLLNFKLFSTDIPALVIGLESLSGVLVPVLIALIPIGNASRITVREAVNDYGISRKSFGSGRMDKWLKKLKGVDRTLLLSIRNAFRRKSRLALSLSLLAAAGGIFIASLNVQAAWEQYLNMASADRHYDLEIRLNRMYPMTQLTDVMTQVPGVERFEAWNIIPVAAYRQDGLNIVRTYPDGGHGSFSLRSTPLQSQLVSRTFLSGRWLQAEDQNGIVLNHMAASLFPGIKAGDSVTLNVNGQPYRFIVVGITREIITPASAYVLPETFEDASGMFGLNNAIRIVMTQHDSTGRIVISKDIEHALESAGIKISTSILETRLDAAISGHVYILIFALIIMSVLMAIVGIIGLMSNMGTSVVERTREFGVMRAIGGKSYILQRNVIGEGVVIALMSWIISVLFSIPLSAFIGNLVGKMAFNLPLSLVLSPLAIIIWLLIVILGAIAASIYPARQAARMTVRETLNYI